jgi:thiol-disulfide isomerase/thioredoxin
LLAQQVVREFGDRVQYVVEDFGASPMADRFGIDKYPAIFVDDALVAVPEDFYAWGGPGKGKYLPWTDLANRKEFQSDLRHLIESRLAGGELRSVDRPAAAAASRLTLPRDIAITDLSGKTFKLGDLRGKPILVEFWAPWCPPCLETMTWMKKLDGSAHIVALAVESERPAVENVVAKLQPPGRIAMASEELKTAFGGIPAVPLLYLADDKGRIVKTFYGAPPDLHAQIEAALKSLR